MTTKKTKSRAVQALEKASGGPLTLGGLLMAIREGEEINQAQFAKRLGVNRAHICDIEKGRKLVSPERAAAWAKKLGYSEPQFVRLALQDLLAKEGLPYTLEIHAA